MLRLIASKPTTTTTSRIRTTSTNNNNHISAAIHTTTHLSDKHTPQFPRHTYVGRPLPQWGAFSCTECMQCVDACEQGALHKVLLSRAKLDAAPTTLAFDTAPSVEPNSYFAFVTNDDCNGCGDCVERCAELQQGGCYYLDDTAALNNTTSSKNTHTHLNAKNLWNYVQSLPKWDPTDCTQCNECVDACPNHAVKKFSIPNDNANAAPFTITSVNDKQSPDKQFIIQVDPDSCANCQDCIAACQTEHDGTKSCLTLEDGLQPKEDAHNLIKYAKEASSHVRDYTIMGKKSIGSSGIVFEMVVKAPEIAKYCEAGHFLMVCTDEKSERIPLTVADYDRVNETITIVLQDVGASTNKICAMDVGERFFSVAGPLGKTTHIKNYDAKKDGKVVVIGGGVGVAPAYPVARSFKKQPDTHVTSIIGFRNEGLKFWDDKMDEVSHELITMTDDGSYGQQGYVSQGLQKMIDDGEKIAEVFAVGPVPMMDSVVQVSKKYNIKTTVSINSMMVDGTGMCGCCRVEIEDKTKFACIHGPEFDGLKLDWDSLKSRQKQYLHEESVGREHQSQCQMDADVAPAKDRIPMNHQDPKVRVTNWNEVATGYTPLQAIAEARRCIQCATPTCMPGCPVQIDIPGFIKLIAEGNFIAASEKIKETNVVPSMTGRVCPQENQCEGVCIFEQEGEEQQPIAIGRLERFCADYENSHKLFDSDKGKQIIHTGKKVAVIGSGPAGIATAGDLAQFGHKVVIYEALHKPGGVLGYGIPEFRLPKSIVDDEFRALEALGVELKLNVPIGPGLKVPDLLKREGFNAVFLGLGAGAPNFLGIKGEGLNGVLSGNEFLTRINLMKAFQFPNFETPVLAGIVPKNVVVIGAGNTAMDVARSAMRLNPDGNVYLVYRRTIHESPAREEEKEHAIEEGLKVKDLTTPKRILGNDKGWVTGMVCTSNKLGTPDSGGRRRPIEIPDTEHTLDVDMVVLAIGNGSNEMLTSTFPELELNQWGNIVADKTGKTNVKGVFAGGDIVIGAATVIEAAGAGKTAAESINKYLMDENDTW